MSENKHKYSIPRVKGSQLSCTLVGALSVLLNLRNTAVLLHGTPGCAHYGLKFCQQMLLREGEIIHDFSPPRMNFRTTALSENELIFGGEDLLRQKIEETLATFPDFPLLVIPSCTVEVIGDDVSGVCEEMSHRTGREVVYFSMGGFLKGDHFEGINSAYFDLIDRFLKPASDIDPRRVNLVAERSLMPTADIDFMEVRRLLALLGLDINTRFVRNLDFKALPDVPRAALNLPASTNQSLSVCERLCQKFQTPYIQEGFPGGFEDTRTWLSAIRDALKLDADIEELMAAEKDFFLQEMSRRGNPFKGLKIIVNTAPLHLGWLVEFLDLLQADILEMNILSTGYFEADFLDAPGGLSCPVNSGMDLEAVLANNLQKKADVYLQCSSHHAPIPNHQPGLLVREVPLFPPVGPRGLLNLFVEWSRWLQFTGVEGWRNESSNNC